MRLRNCRSRYPIFALQFPLTNILQQPQEFDYSPSPFDFGDDCRFFRAPNPASNMVYIRKEYRRAKEFIMEESLHNVYMVQGSPGEGMVLLPTKLYR